MRMSGESIEERDHPVNVPPTTKEDSQLESASQTISSSDEPSTSVTDDSNCVAFGPIVVKPRTKAAPTLATGRRSRYEPLPPDEDQKREKRRARNRAAAERVRLRRLGIQEDLQGQINTLLSEKQRLSAEVNTLQQQKIRLESSLAVHERMCSVSTFSPTTTGASALSHDNNPLDFATEQVDGMADLHLDDQSFDSYPSLQTPQMVFDDTIATTAGSYDNPDPFMIDP